MLIEGSQATRFERSEPIASPGFKFKLGPEEETQGKLEWKWGRGKIDPYGNHKTWLVVRDSFSRRSIEFSLSDTYPPEERQTIHLGEWPVPSMEGVAFGRRRTLRIALPVVLLLVIGSGGIWLWQSSVDPLARRHRWST